MLTEKKRRHKVWTDRIGPHRLVESTPVVASNNQLSFYLFHVLVFHHDNLLFLVSPYDLLEDLRDVKPLRVHVPLKLPLNFDNAWSWRENIFLAMASEKTLSLTVPERIDVIKDSSDGNFFSFIFIKYSTAFSCCFLFLFMKKNS